ncbi:MAG: hypothetical protein EOP10_08085, partial [Proteobacteria bacterium]
NRRDFLRTSAWAGASFYFLPASFARGQGVLSPKGFPKSVCFGGRTEFEGPLLVLSGSVPRDIQGHAFIVESLDTPQRTNLVSGAGSLLRVDFENGRALAKRKLIRTPSVIAQELFESTEHRFESKGVAYMSKSLGILNNCNTAAVAIENSRLILSYDAGEPYEVDLKSLSIITPVGGRSEWSQGLPKTLAAFQGNPVFPMIRATAHPFYDSETKTFISVNFGGQINIAGLPIGKAFTDIVLWDGEGLLQKHPLTDENGKTVVIKQAVHTLCVSRHYVLIFDTPFSFEAESILGFPKVRSQEVDTPVWIIPRSVLDGSGAAVRAKKVVLEKEWEHIFADFDDSDGVITLYGATSPATDFSECLQSGDRLAKSNEPINPDHYGMIPAPLDRGDCGRIRIDMTKSKPSADIQLTSHPLYSWQTALAAVRRQKAPLERHEAIFWISFGFTPELAVKRMSAVYDRYKYRQVPVSQLPWEGVAPALFRYDCASMAIDKAYSFPAGAFPSSPLFMPRTDAQSQTDGYILCTIATDERLVGKTGDELWIFDCRSLEAGPICKLHHTDLDMALTLHTEWIDAIEERKSNYRIDMREAYSEALAAKSNDMQAIFDSQIFPQFDYPLSH